MTIEFFKYHGTGNDFIILDNRDNRYNNLTNEQINLLCDRHFGIGADGLMLLNNSKNLDFSMKYFNSDGYEGTMCGNGGRCIVSFAKYLRIIETNTTFEAIDGLHTATINDDFIVKLKMNNIDNKTIIQNNNFFLIDSGSPHYIEFIDSFDNIDIIDRGKKIRFDKTISDKGVNVNFVKIIEKDCIFVRTYERGVENETLSCGTGSIASAIAYKISQKSNSKVITVKTLGGNLNVFSEHENNIYKNIILSGEAKYIFKGKIEL